MSAGMVLIVFFVMLALSVPIFGALGITSFLSYCTAWPPVSPWETYVTDLGQGNMQEEIPVYSFQQIEEIYGALHQYLQQYKQPFSRKIEQIDPPWRNIN